VHRFWETLFATDEWTFMRTNNYPSDPPPSHLCPEHRRLWLAWRDNFYQPQKYVNNPFIPIQCTPTHEQNRTARYRLNAEQMTSIENNCKSNCQESP